jgi:hypothetical protein
MLALVGDKTLTLNEAMDKVYGESGIETTPMPDGLWDKIKAAVIKGDRKYMEELFKHACYAVREDIAGDLFATVAAREPMAMIEAIYQIDNEEKAKGNTKGNSDEWLLQ